MRFRTRGFTLVELLVVIGIIALLVSILLPSLQSARRAAITVKCESALREIGSATMFYVNDNKGWAPPCKTNGTSTVTYGIGYPNYIPPVTVNSAGQYWWAFLARYTTRKIMGQTGATGDQRNDATVNNVLWGCPAFTPYTDTQFLGNLNPADTGYGWNAFPEYTASFPDPNNPLPNTIGDTIDPNAISVVVPGPKSGGHDWSNPSAGRWYKFTQYKNPSERALVADNQFWLMEVQGAPKDGTFPGQKAFSDWTLWVANDGHLGEATYDFYRHGRYPPPDTIAGSGSAGGAVGQFKSIGGKVAYNVLFCDGHVLTLTDRAAGYKAARLRYPG